MGHSGSWSSGSINWGEGLSIPYPFNHCQHKVIKYNIFTWSCMVNECFDFINSTVFLLMFLPGKCISAFPCKGKWSESVCEIQLPLIKNLAVSWLSLQTYSQIVLKMQLPGNVLFLCSWLFVYKVRAKYLFFSLCPGWP